MSSTFRFHWTDGFPVPRIIGPILAAAICLAAAPTFGGPLENPVTPPSRPIPAMNDASTFKWRWLADRINRKDPSDGPLFPFLSTIKDLALSVNGQSVGNPTADTGRLGDLLHGASTSISSLAASIRQYTLTWDRSNDKVDLTIKQPLAEGQTWSLTGVGGGSTTGRYLLGLDADRQFGQVTAGMGYRFLAAGGPDDAPLDQNWNMALQFDQWRLQGTLDERGESRKARLTLGYTDGAWWGSVTREYDMTGDNDRLAATWGHNWQLWRIQGSVGLQWNRTLGLENDQWSPSVEARLPAGDFALAWKMSCDSLNSWTDLRADDIDQTISLTYSPGSRTTKKK